MILNEVTLQGFLYKKCEELTACEKRQVSIAMAIVKGAKVILADETATGLDSDDATKIIKTLKKLSKNRLVIFTTHDIELADQYSDRIITIDNGVIVEDMMIELTDYKIMIENNKEVKFGFKVAKIISLGLLSSLEKIGRTISFAVVLFLVLTMFLCSSILTNTTKSENILSAMENEKSNFVTLIKYKNNENAINRGLLSNDEFITIKNKYPQIRLYKTFSNCTYGGANVVFHYQGIVEVSDENLNFIYGRYPQNQNEFFITKDRAEQILTENEKYSDLNNLIGQEFAGFVTQSKQILCGITDIPLPDDYAFYQEGFSQNWSTTSNPACFELVAFLSKDTKTNRAFIDEYLNNDSGLKQDQSKIVLRSPIIDTFTSQIDVFYSFGTIMIYTSVILLVLIGLFSNYSILSSITKKRGENNNIIALGSNKKSLFCIYLVKNIVSYLLSLPFVIISSLIFIGFLNSVVEKTELTFIPYYISLQNITSLFLLTIITWICSTLIPFIKILRIQPVDIL